MTRRFCLNCLFKIMVNLSILREFTTSMMPVDGLFTLSVTMPAGGLVEPAAGVAD